jgi:ribosomal-protein-alanine N-acetyltransferase
MRWAIIRLSMRIATRYSVRAMNVGDIQQVLEIERQSFPTMWPPTAFKRELQQNRLANYIVIVEHNESAPEIEAEPPPDRHANSFERLFGELRSFLGPREERPLPAVSERPELIVGFVGVWMLPDEAHIVTIAVRDQFRRQGLGEQLLISAIEMAQEEGQSLVTLEVRVSNEAALRLYEKYGFEQVGLRPRYYSDNHEDANVLTVQSVVTEKYRARFDELRTAHRRRWGDFDLV